MRQATPLVESVLKEPAFIRHILCTMLVLKILQTLSLIIPIARQGRNYLTFYRLRFREVINYLPKTTELLCGGARIGLPIYLIPEHQFSPLNF